MSLSDSELLELNELSNALVDHRITAEQRERLSQMLARSADARRFYVRAMSLSASLFDYAGEMIAEEPDAKIVPLGKPRTTFWWWGSLAAAAAVALAFWLGEKRSDSAAEKLAEVQDTEETVAHLSGAKECRWSGRAAAMGDDFSRGQRLEIASGFAEITFDSGARIEVEGPASLELTSAWGATLQRGSLKATVPPEAIGFRVANAAVDVVDLGTEFSMVADDSGATEVFVLKGAVEAETHAAADAKSSVTLREKQARRFARNGASEVNDREQKLARFSRMIAFDRLTRPAEFLHWSFDDATQIARCETIGVHTHDVETRISGGTGVSVEGRWQRALQLDGSVSVTAPFSNGARRAIRTAAFWLKIPTDTPLAGANEILGWQLGKQNRSAVIGWNSNPDRGSIGALRIGSGKGFHVGGTSLRDGQWHHVASIFPGGKQQVKTYIDGRLESLVQRGGKRRGDLELNASGEPQFWIGRAPGSAGSGFRGQIDELFLANRELSPQEIRHLMRQNRPGPDGLLAAD